MKVAIDTDRNELVCEDSTGSTRHELYSDESFSILSRLWLKVGWNQKYTYTFSWMGRPIIQLPDDLMRIQEVIYRTRPDVIIETGVAHGGSLIFYASLCKAIGSGRVIGVDIEIRPHNRQAIEAHALSDYITLVEANSVEPSTVARVKDLVKVGERVLALLDSNHSKAHVRSELEQYSSLVTPGSYIVATDGIMSDLHDVPRGRSDWVEDNPAEAAVEFAREHAEFVLEPPPWPFNESGLAPAKHGVTHWPGAWLRRV